MIHMERLERSLYMQECYTCFSYLRKNRSAVLIFHLQLGSAGDMIDQQTWEERFSFHSLQSSPESLLCLADVEPEAWRI